MIKLEHLKKMADKGNLPHALLVSGVSAKDFIRRIFSHDADKKFHPDFIFISPEGKEIQISQIRDCIWRLSLKPSLLTQKVAVIDQAHCISRAAQSALLKTLEEPKGFSSLVLVTDYPSLLFPTILSRVQKVKLFPENKTKTQDYSVISALTKSDLAVRFQYAEKIAKSSDLSGILTDWLNYFRRDLVKNKNILELIQKTFFLIEKTNVNRRLALEYLMLNDNF